MILTFVIGLVLIRQLLSVGQQAYSVYALVVAGFGLSILLREMLRVSLVGRLNAVLYDRQGDANAVSDLLSQALRLALVGAVLAALLMGIVALALPKFGIEGDNLFWAQMFVAVRALYVLAAVGIYPVVLYVLASGRQVHLNFILLIERVLELAALLIVLWFGIGRADPFLSLFAFGSIFLASVLIFYIGLWRMIVPMQPLFAKTLSVPALWRKYRADLWDGFRDITGPMLFFRFDLVLLAAMFGQPAILVLSLGIQLTGYVLQSCMGLVSGLEAVFGRVWFKSAKSDDADAKMRSKLIWKVSALQATVLAFMCGFLVINLDTLLRLWLGDRLDGAVFSYSELYILVCIFLPGIVASSFSQSWTTMLTGAGRLGDFVGYLLGFSILNPILLVALTIGLALDAWTALVLAAILYSILKVACYGIVLPIVVGRTLGIRYGQLYRPAVLPAVGGGITTLVSLLVSSNSLTGSVLIYGVGFAAVLYLLKYDTSAA